MALEHALEGMKLGGSAVSVSWGEDTDCWEVSWITGGNRYTGISKNLLTAVRLVVEDAEAERGDSGA